MIIVTTLAPNMSPFFVFFSVLFGVIVGSFSNVLIMRHGTGVGIGGRSRCMVCGVTLAFHELVPLLSYIAQRGRCRHCHTVFSWHYPAVELLGGIYFGVIAVSAIGALEGALLALAGIPLLVIAGYDLKHFIIPPFYMRFVWLVALTGVALFFNQATIIAALGFMLFFYSIWFFSDGRAMGFGDVELVLALSLLFGWPVSGIGVLFAFWIGAAVGIALLFQNRYRLTLKSEVPFGPFLVMGFILALFVVRIFIEHPLFYV